MFLFVVKQKFHRYDTFLHFLLYKLFNVKLYFRGDPNLFGIIIGTGHRSQSEPYPSKTESRNLGMLVGPAPTSLLHEYQNQLNTTLLCPGFNWHLKQVQY